MCAILVAALCLTGPGCDGADAPGRNYLEKRFDSLADNARGRAVPVTILWPAGGEAARPSPLVVLSHGGAGSRRSYRSLATHLAGEGYVVAIPEHVGSNRRALLQGMWRRLSGPRTVLWAMARDTAEWRARPADIRFVIDQASRWNRSDTDLRGRIDLERVGVLGHSYGAYTALAAAGARVQVAGVSSDFSDPRVDAMVALSPSGPGGWGWFSETSYQSVDVPALLVTGSQDTMTDWQSGSWRKQAFDLMSPGPRYCLWLEGATHLDFADLPLASQRAATVHRIVETMTALFFEAHLKQDPVARKALQNAARAAALAGPAIPELQWYTKGG